MYHFIYSYMKVLVTCLRVEAITESREVTYLLRKTQLVSNRAKVRTLAEYMHVLHCFAASNYEWMPLFWEKDKNVFRTAQAPSFNLSPTSDPQRLFLMVSQLRA